MCLGLCITVVPPGVGRQLRRRRWGLPGAGTCVSAGRLPCRQLKDRERNWGWHCWDALSDGLTRSVLGKVSCGRQVPRLLKWGRVPSLAQVVLLFLAKPVRSAVGLSPVPSETPGPWLPPCSQALIVPSLPAGEQLGPGQSPGASEGGEAGWAATSAVLSAEPQGP